MRIRQIGQPDIADRRAAAADQDRRAVEDQAIDQAGAQKRRRGPRPAFDQHMVGGKRRDRAGRVDRRPSRDRRAGRQQHPHGRPIRQSVEPHVQRRHIGVVGSTPDQDRLVPTALEMRVRARRGTRDPAAAAVRQRDAAVERGRQLERHHRPAVRAARKETRHRPPRLRGQDTGLDRDPRRPQPRDAGARGPRIGVLDRDDDARHPRRDQQVRTGRPPRRDMRARFQRDGRGRPARRVARRGQRHRLGMRSPAGLRPAPSDDDPVAHDQATDIGIGRGTTARPFA